MSEIDARGVASGVIAFITSTVAAVIVAATPQPAAAQPPEELAPFFIITEIRAGVLAANLENGGSEDANVLINGEVLFGKLGHSYDDPIWDIFLRPRPHVGFSLNPGEGGTNQVYAGVTWEVRLTNWAFVEASFGGNDPNSYGCATLFRESASLGFDVAERTRVLFTVDHMSNAGLCDQNQGLTNVGVRLGYRW
jgi:lipid A 3-O-deacylase